MNFKCRHCGEDFKASKEEMALYQEGYALAPEFCDDCFRFVNSPSDLEYEQYSDADPGL
jgi:hypothetical protein